ncbi:MAG: SPASM domain-containing protein [Candidatus Bathyarchaeota archaeon]|nr:MAG: SPASM domain-containing protein [Candidatus Bathyarchaeota archaeon]
MFRTAYQKVKRAREFIGGCGSGRLYCALQSNGDITPCVFIPSWVIGNLRNEEFLELARALLKEMKTLNVLEIGKTLRKIVELVVIAIFVVDVKLVPLITSIILLLQILDVFIIGTYGKKNLAGLLLLFQHELS